MPALTPDDLLRQADRVRSEVGDRFRDDVVTSLYTEAGRLADGAVTRRPGARLNLGYHADRALTHPLLGVPIMLLMLALVFWLTILGANVPSAFLAGVLMEEGGLTGWLDTYFGVQAPGFASASLYELLYGLADWLGAPGWLSGFLLDGVYLCLAWVISVMLPPMAIFFPLFTLLEDVGYLPRIAFNLDWMFKKAGAHGKQALTMAMGFGCNAAGVIACRIIDSPREKLIAIITNNFMICNGRFPTVIMVALVAAGSASGGGMRGSLIATLIVVAVVLLGVLFTFLVSWVLSKTLLRGEPSAFTLELPPYRRPSILRVIHRSLIDRTIFVLWRACLVAVPAGAAIWIVANVSIGGTPVAQYIVNFLDPLGQLMGLDGSVLLAYIIAIPANEIVVPTLMMLYVQNDKMIELEGAAFANVLNQQGWTPLTAVSLLLFCLLHNPCGTTIWTIWKETRSVRWTAIASLMPVVLGIVICIVVAGIWRLVT
jgi:ferrous iron transport protein B